MNRIQRTLGTLAALPLLLAPLGCDQANEAAAKAKEGLEDASGKVGDLANMGKDMLANGLGDLQPKISDAIENLKGGAGDLSEGMKEKLSKLQEIDVQLPDIISNLKNGTGEALTGAMEKAKEFMVEIPKLLSSLTGN